MSRGPNYGLALLGLFVATFFTSTAGLLLRLMEGAGGWTVLFYRALFFAATMILWLLLRYRSQAPKFVRRVGWHGLIPAVSFAAATVSFIFALGETTVARVVLINSMIPFVTALIGWVWLKEKISKETLIAMFVAVAGIGVMMMGGPGNLADGGSFMGDLLSGVCCIVTSFMFVSFRRNPEVDKVPTTLLGGLLVAAVAFILTSDLAISPHDLWLCALLGIFQLAVQYILVTYGSQHVPAAEVSLVGRITLVLAPMWVWIGVGEVPGSSTLWGGSLVILAVFGNGLWALLKRRKPAPSAGMVGRQL